MILNSEQYVNFKTARLLKEDGFDVPCKRFFFKDGTPGISKEETNHNGTTCGSYSRPTLMIAAKWACKAYNIKIAISSVLHGGWMYKAEHEGRIIVDSSHAFKFERAFEKCIQKVLNTNIRWRRKEMKAFADRMFLAVAVLCRRWLHLNGFITDMEDEMIHTRIKKWQDNTRTEITEEQLNSADFIYNDNIKYKSNNQDEVQKEDSGRF